MTKPPLRMDGLAPAMLTIENGEKPWLEDPASLDAQIALVREMWRVRLLDCGGDQADPTLIALSEIVLRLVKTAGPP